MSDPQENDPHPTAEADDAEPATDETPPTEELEDPSTEKAPGDEPKGGTEQSGADHQAVGIGVVGRPQVDPDAVGD